MRRLADKDQQLTLAREAGVDTPRSALVTSPGDLLGAADEVSFPAVLKPCTPHAMLNQTGLKAAGVESRQDLESVYARFPEVGTMLLQEVIPARNDAIAIAAGYWDAQSRPVATFTGRKLRQHPRQFGVTRLAESRRLEVADLTLRFLHQISYHGLYDLEFMLDPRDGRYKFIEINARQPLWVPLATAAGVNLSFIAYRDLIGHPITAIPQRDGVGWTNLWQDAPDSFAEWRSGELSLGEWVRPLTNVRADAWLSLSDPAPVLRELGRRAAAFTGRAARLG
jgi:predicted ATP-grasp superfamily ATP-dependent carboligase